jgi:biopolymer transport protein ExbB/TolQ
MNELFKESDFPKDFLFQISSLFISVLFVHSLYLLFIEPSASFQVALAESQNRAPDRTLSVILKDFEQETCLMLALWALSIIFIKWKRIKEQTEILSTSIFNLDPEKDITLENVSSLQDKLDNKEKGLLVNALNAGLHKFKVSGNIEDASSSAHDVCEQESERMESELSMIRYIIWAIPSIGFIGTVRGIGEALSQAHIAVEGDIAGMTASLGVAFNSTYVALVVSIFLMFFLHQLQLIQDRLTLDSHDYCNKNFVDKMRS